MFPLSEKAHDDKLSKEDKSFIHRLAKKIHDSGFVTPSIFFLEMVRPLASLGGHMMVFMGPIINGFIQSDGYYRAAELLNKKETLSILLDEIEHLELLDSKDGKKEYI